MRLDQMAIGLNYLNTLKLQWPFYIAIFVNGHFIFMNEVPGHFINREMAIGCCTELLEYTEIVMAILYCYLSKWPFYELFCAIFVAPATGHFIEACTSITTFY